ncbi:MAG: hypothetical protein MZV70_14250 [Desulfobacterales bacterium]|nr:hypothetical protein [Desulfobacterales bacterium]
MPTTTKPNEHGIIQVRLRTDDDSALAAKLRAGLELTEEGDGARGAGRFAVRGRRAQVSSAYRGRDSR